MKLREGNIFTGVCLLTWGWGRGWGGILIIRDGTHPLSGYSPPQIYGAWDTNRIGVVHVLLECFLVSSCPFSFNIKQTKPSKRTLLWARPTMIFQKISEKNVDQTNSKTFLPVNLFLINNDLNLQSRFSTRFPLTVKRRILRHHVIRWQEVYYRMYKQLSSLCSGAKVRAHTCAVFVYFF